MLPEIQYSYDINLKQESILLRIPFGERFNAANDAKLRGDRPGLRLEITGSWMMCVRVRENS